MPLSDPKLIRAIDNLAFSTLRISHGGDQPAGLEMLSMAISGEGPHGSDRNLAESVERGLNAIAEAVRSGLEDVAAAMAGFVRVEVEETESDPRDLAS